MSDWLTVLSERLDGGECCALVTVADARGSTPREVGAKMLVSHDSIAGSIGGGNLEFKAMEIARALLGQGESEGEGADSSLRRFPLGPGLGQCCGGVAVLLFETVSPEHGAWVRTVTSLRRRDQPAVLVSRADAPVGADKLVVTAGGHHGGLGDADLERRAVSTARSLMNGDAEMHSMSIQKDESATLLFEPLRASDFHIELFGAGHVGRALIQILQGLPCTVRWTDSREAQFPRELPPGVTACRVDDPEYEVDAAPPGSYFLIMTHRHDLDQAICERILRRVDWRYCGLIGSASKRRKFEKRLMARGVSGEALARLVCPIGVGGISGKHPGEIAVAVAAELLQERESADAAQIGAADVTGD